MTNTAVGDQREVDAKEAALRARQKATPGNAQLNFELARLLTESGRRGDALQFIEQACKLAPNNFHYLYYCGALYRDFGQHGLAVELLKTSVAIEPRVFLSQYDLADCYYRLGQGHKAEEHYRAALKLASNLTETNLGLTGLARCLANSGAVDEAISLYERCSRDSSGTRGSSSGSRKYP
jgi:tetratricopeptide (TPR) repeat protein